MKANVCLCKHLRVSIPLQKPCEVLLLHQDLWQSHGSVSSLKVVCSFGPRFKKPCCSFLIFFKQKYFLLPQILTSLETRFLRAHTRIKSKLCLPVATNLNHSDGACEVLKQEPETYQPFLGMQKANCSECLLDGNIGSFFY